MDSLRVLFAGDFAPCRGFESLVLDKKQEVLGDALKLILASDISFVNLECPLTTSGVAINKPGPALKASPKTIEALKQFSVVGLANNHIFDYGEDGLRDTLETCKEAGIATVGAGLSLEEAQQVYLHEAKGVSLAIIAIAEHEFNLSEDGGAGAAPIDAIDNYKQISIAKELADIVIITIHGGNEYFPYPRPNLRKLCKHFIDLGVDAIICHHPHVPGSYESYRGRPIFYSIGNLIFDSSSPKAGWEKGYFVELIFNPATKSLLSFGIHPYMQSVKYGGVQLLTGDDRESFISDIESYRALLLSDTRYNEAWAAFVDENINSYILRSSPFRFRGAGFLIKKFPFLAGMLYGKRNSDLDRLNLIRCQSHLDVLSESLKKALGGKYK